MTQSEFLVIATGGTIDSYFDPATDSMRPLDESAAEEYFKVLKVPFEYSVITVCMKDSRDLTDDDRRKIAEVIREKNIAHIVITHGTFTMPQTAEYLSKHKDFRDKTIVLTGAFVPIKQFGAAFSDAPFNFGYAVAQAQSAAPGVYLAMHGTLFPAGQVKKNVSAAKFEPFG